jgi:hypothetical protein
VSPFIFWKKWPLRRVRVRRNSSSFDGATGLTKLSSIPALSKSTYWPSAPGPIKAIVEIPAVRGSFFNSTQAVDAENEPLQESSRIAMRIAFRAEMNDLLDAFAKNRVEPVGLQYMFEKEKIVRIRRADKDQWSHHSSPRHYD